MSDKCELSQVTRTQTLIGYIPAGKPDDTTIQPAIRPLLRGQQLSSAGIFSTKLVAAIPFEGQTVCRETTAWSGFHSTVGIGNRSSIDAFLA